jgi:hypothetical protein
MRVSSFNSKAIKKVSIVSLAAILITVFLFIRMQRNTTVHYEKQSFSRQYKGTLKLERRISFPDNYNLGDIKYFNDHIFISDLSSQHIIKLDSSGNEIDRFRYRTDDLTPSSNSLIIGWGMDSMGIYLADARQNSITTLNYQNEVIDEHSLDFNVARAGFLGDNEFIIKAFDTKSRDKENFILINYIENSSKLLNHPAPELRDSDFKLDGFFVCNRDGINFHVCYMTGLMHAFDKEGNILYTKNTIDNSPFPKVVKSGGYKRFHPLAKKINYSATADQEFLYILSGVHSLGDTTSTRVIDTYNVINGEYLWSIKAPKYEGSDAKKILVRDEGFYMYQAKGISYYKIN